MIDENWAKLSADGDARRIPQLLKALTLADDARRPEVWSELQHLVEHQGTIYEATAPTVAALITGAADRMIPRIEVLDFVAYVFLDGESTEGPDELARRLRRATCNGYPLYVEAINSTDAAEREAGAHVLGWLPECGADSVPLLEKMVIAESNESALAIAIWALGNLLREPKEDLFARVAKDAKTALPRAVARAFLARWQGRNTSEENTRAIAHAIYQRVGEGTRLPFISWKARSSRRSVGSYSNRSRLTGMIHDETRLLHQALGGKSGRDRHSVIVEKA